MEKVYMPHPSIEKSELDETRVKLMATCKLNILTVGWNTLDEGLISP